MKLKTFEDTLLALRGLYDSAVAQDCKLEEALGGDTQIASDWWDNYITDSLHIIERDLKDETGIVGWLFWDSMSNSDGYCTFKVDGEEYEGSPKNVWLRLKGKLCNHEEEPFNYNKPAIWFAEAGFQRGEVIPDEDVENNIFGKTLSRILILDEVRNTISHYMFEMLNTDTVLKVEADIEAVLASFSARGYIAKYNIVSDELEIAFNIAYSEDSEYNEYIIIFSESGITFDEVPKVY